MGAMRVMVCGGAGFLGSHLIERLLADGCEVDAVDDLSTGSLSNLAGARGAAGRFKFDNLGVDAPEFAELVSLRRPRVIVNLVSFAPSLSGADGALRSLRAAAAILEAARLSAVTKVVCALPASLLYGQVAAKELPVKEGHVSEARTAAEVLARAACELHRVHRDRYGTEFTVLAVANAYGPRQRPEDGVVAAFLSALEGARPAIVHGTGRQTRDFVHVDDVTDALARSLEKGDGAVVNIGSGTATSVKDLWSTMAGASRLAPRESAGRPDDITRLAVSVVRARIQLGWAPTVTLREGLAGLR